MARGTRLTAPTEHLTARVYAQTKCELEAIAKDRSTEARGGADASRSSVLRDALLLVTRDPDIRARLVRGDVPAPSRASARPTTKDQLE